MLRRAGGAAYYSGTGGTPGYSPSFHADTPGMAPSPGMVAPTPGTGAYVHPSPMGVAYSPGGVGTPAMAPTPGGMTPGAGGGAEPASAMSSYEHWQDVEVGGQFFLWE